MTSYDDYTISAKEIQLFRDAIVQDRIATYCGLHNTNPSLAIINSWYNSITDEEIIAKYKNENYQWYCVENIQN